MPVIPSVPSSSQEILQGLNRFAKKLGQLPLDEIGQNLENSLAGIDRLVNNPDLGKSIASLRRIMAELKTA